MKSPFQIITYLGNSYGYSAICGDSYKIEIRVKDFAPTDTLEVGIGLKLKGFVRQEVGKYFIV